MQREDAQKRASATRSLREAVCLLSAAQRQLVEQTIRAHCDVRGWRLWAVNCRTNHVHVVVTANLNPAEVVRQFKAWTTRRLRGNSRMSRKNWWTERGSKRWINDEAGLEAAIEYVLNSQ